MAHGWWERVGPLCLNLILLNLPCFVMPGRVVMCHVVLFPKKVWHTTGPRRVVLFSCRVRPTDIFTLKRPLWGLIGSEVKPLPLDQTFFGMCYVHIFFLLTFLITVAESQLYLLFNNVQRLLWVQVFFSLVYCSPTTLQDGYGYGYGYGFVFVSFLLEKDRNRILASSFEPCKYLCSTCSSWPLFTSCTKAPAF